MVVSYVVMEQADADVLWSGLGAVAIIALIGVVSDNSADRTRATVGATPHDSSS
jgi:hypothetical protein